jgi:hypothetical protein
LNCSRALSAVHQVELEAHRGCLVTQKAKQSIDPMERLVRVCRVPRNIRRFHPSNLCMHENMRASPTAITRTTIARTQQNHENTTKLADKPLPQTRMHACTRAHTRTHAHTYRHTQTNTHRHTLTNTNAHTYTHIHTHIHTQTPTHTNKHTSAGKPNHTHPHRSSLRHTSSHHTTRYPSMPCQATLHHATPHHEHACRRAHPTHTPPTHKHTKPCCLSKPINNQTPAHNL